MNGVAMAMNGRIRYQVVDSHRNLSARRAWALAMFFAEVKGLAAEETEQQVRFCDWYEKEHAVKWFEVVATEGGEVVGYLRCLRNPEDPTEWFIGDVHVRKANRRQGIAEKMYEKVVSEVSAYEAAERLIASVHPCNSASIRLHKKCGFADTGKPCDFPTFFFDPRETAFVRTVYRNFPVPDAPEAVERMLPLWMEMAKEKATGNTEGKKKVGEKHPDEVAQRRKLERVIKDAASGKCVFEAIWCGNRLVGFHYEDGASNIEYLQK